MLFTASRRNLLSFVARGAAAIPHPQKAHRGGEDAYLTHPKSIAVADGVGGWATSGINPAMFARAIMDGGLQQLESITTKNGNDPKLPNAIELMRAGHALAIKKRLQGSCAAITSVIVDDKFLSVCNLGDCGLMLFRNGNVLFRSSELQHFFNCPYQLDGSGSGDKPSDGSVSKLELKEGDIALMGSDGLFDNVEDEKILQLVRENLFPTGSVNKTAMRIAQEASTISKDKSALTPFARKAIEEMRSNPRKYGTGNENSAMGGKVDDITVVVARVGNDTDDGKKDKEDICVPTIVELLNIKS